MNLKLNSFRFDVYVSPENMHTVEVGKTVELSVDDMTFHATIVSIDGNRVTHEVAGDGAEYVKPYFQSKPMSFSMSGQKGVH